MKYMTYCLKFNFFAEHSTVINNKNSDFHSHIWNIAVYIDANDKFEHFHKTEGVITGILDEYSNKILNNEAPFDKTEPIMENIGAHFFEKIQKALAQFDLKLNSLEISETPSRIYVLRSNEHSIKNVKTNAANKLLGEIINFTEKHASNILFQQPEQQNDTGNAKKEKPVPREIPDVKKVKNEKPEENKRVALKAFCGFLAIMFLGVVLLYYVNRKGSQPWGSDAFGHIFKADLLYNEIKKGNFYPLYTNLWYNGIQPFRYWAPVPYYILAVFQLMAGGDAIAAYNIFIFFCFVAGGFGWLIWGVKERNVLTATILGVLWFCMPDNVRVFFSEGNVPRIVIAVILPYMFFFIWQYIEHKRKYALVAVILTMTLVSVCHLMIAAMLGITSFFFLLYYGIKNRHFGRPLQVLIGMLLGISVCGVWLYPALQGGLMAINAEAVAEVMKALTFPFTQSLNPMLRFGNIEIYYFGLAFALIAVVGVFMSDKKSVPGFLTILTVFLGTTTALVPILIKLPLNQLLWMMRFTPIAYAVFTLSVILWKNIKKYFLVIILALILIDSGISFRLLAFNSTPPADTVKMLDEALGATSQRIAIMDLSQFGSFPSYYLCSDSMKKPYAYGWAWQGATTADNIVMLNTALEKEYYAYMFDRCVELGCDTVIVKKDLIKDFEKLDGNAAKSSYYLYKEFPNGYLYKRETPNSFGIKSRYYGLAIGEAANLISLEFPGYQTASSVYLDDYTLEDLSQYEVIYISGFKYRNKKKAEKLMFDAGDAGVKVVVDMNRVPNDAVTNRLTFMGVTAQPIQFEYKLPDLHFENVVYFPTTFKEENRNWNTVYLDGVPNPTGFSWMGGNKITFIGQDVNRNINYVGFNLFYHGMVNEDRAMIDVYAGIMGKNAETLPEREIIPIDISYENNKIVVNSPETGVNTSLANLDAFVSEQETYPVHNLLCVKERRTELDIIYPYIKKGWVISAFGGIASLLFLWFSFKKRGEGA